MNRLAVLAALAVVTGLLLALPAQSRVEQAGADRYVVVLKTGVDSNAVATLHAQRYGDDARRERERRGLERQLVRDRHPDHRARRPRTSSAT